jgi:predicted 3-demethylubiquinone-9 3-methyltransferase (glyoxalase superfamily)
MSKMAPCLSFDGRAEEAADFYVSTFRNCGQASAIGDIARYGEAGPGPKGAAMIVNFTLADQAFRG